MTIMQTIGNFSNIAGAVSGIAALLGVLRLLHTQRRMNEPVHVVLRLGLENEPRNAPSDRREQEVRLELEMLRRDVSRAELLGRMGSMPMREKGTRFAIHALSPPEFMREVNRVVEGKVSTLVIPVTVKELEQFDLEDRSTNIIA